MNTSELAAVLGECLRLAVKVIPTPDKEAFKYSRGKLSAEVNILLQEAVDMKWPFVVEKWQYKRSVSSEDKVNITDLINQHLPQLMAFLRASILGAQPVWAMSLIFLVDRFLYRIDSSHTLLKIAKALHKRYPETPVAPQVVIRQARVYLNTGKLQKAEYILSSLINNSGATGCWKYHSDSDRILVQAVSVQVRGQVLQKLGLWLESAELIWASLVGFHVLPLPDKKGIGTSLGLLASVLISMNNKEFTTFQKRPHINLVGHIGACQSVTQGTCLLSYSFSKECPSADKQGYLALAKEAFENGLLTKSEKEAVTSQQELHTFLKAAYCLAVTNKWLSGPSEAVAMAFHTCRDATVLLYSYCFDDNSDKNALCTQVMAKVQRVKSLLRVKAFTDSQPRPFLPDGCRAMEDKPVPFSLSDFTKVMESFQKHHKSMSEAFKDSSHTGRRDGQGVTHTHCITAFQTLTESLMTECVTTSLKSTEYGPEALGDIENKDILGLKKSPDHLLEVFQKKTLITTLVTEEDQSGCDSGIAEEGKKGGVVKCEGQSSRSSQGSNSLRSSWLDVHDSGESLVLVDPFWCTEADDSVNVDHDEQDHHGPQEEANNYRCKGGVTANASIHQYGLIHSARDSSQAGTMDKGGSIHQEEPCTTLESENNQIIIKTDTGDTGKVSAGSRSKDSRTSSGSHCSSLGSSWQSVSFSKSPQNEDFAKILEDKHSRVDQNCETVATEDGPDSPFEYIDINPSERPISKAGVANPSASSISKGGVATSLQSRNDVGMTQKGCHSQTCIKDQSSIETLEDQEMSLLIHQLSGFELIDTHAGETKANNDSAKSKPNESHLNVIFHRHLLLSGALVLKYSKATDTWTACETSVYVGELLKVDVEGGQRQAFWVRYLHQELLLGSYVGKEYLRERKIHTHLGDVERQMTAQYYVMEFNKRLYESNVTTQIFYIPSEVLLILEADTITACVSVEPYMVGDFVKLTNNTTKINQRYSSTEFGIAFGHFTYEFSRKEEVVVDLQGWVTANGKGLVYLTDPQIHSLRKSRSPSNFHQNGIRKFLQEQHGERCNPICLVALQRPLQTSSEQKTD
uniref:Alpha-type protein kinase domain-containing protein n=1 Tax=Electrophorus electricus TaxID=8005 RepID=A0A4W4GIC1_ELEEL